MSKRTIQIAALLCLVAGVLTMVTAASIGRRAEVEGRADIIPPVAVEKPSATAGEWMTSYALTERSGRTFESSEVAGKVHVVSFFFASCPTVCRLQNGRVRDLAADFGPEGVVFLSITVDPQNDTPATLQTYAASLSADPKHWLFLTSRDLTYIRRVGAEVYELPVDQQVHSERLVVVDRQGKTRGRFHWNKPDEITEMKNLLHQLLSEPEPNEGGLTENVGGSV